jgi:hypothetical protein
MSERGVAGSPRSCSGELYEGVPTISWLRVSAGALGAMSVT